MKGLIYIGNMIEPLKHCPIHQHDVWEILYYYQGIGVNKTGNTEYKIEPGVIMCQPPGIPHVEYCETGFKNFYLTVKDFPLGQENIYFKDTSSKDFYKILLQLYHEYHAKNPNWFRITESLLTVMNEYLISWSHKTPKNPYVESFEHILISNFSSKSFNINHALQEIPLNPDYFRRLFYKDTGKTPIEYLTELRINYAKQLLENKYSMIKEIAQLSGYDDPYYFSRAFKKVTGKSPTDWKSDTK